MCSRNFLFHSLSLKLFSKTSLSYHTPTPSLLHLTASYSTRPYLIVLNQPECLPHFAAFCYRKHKHHPFRVAHTTELASVLHDRKLGFHNPLSNTTFHRLLLSAHFSSPSRFPHPPSLPLAPCQSPGQLWCLVPGLSSCMAALPECILRQPACSSMGIEARYDSQIRYLTRRATQ